MGCNTLAPLLWNLTSAMRNREVAFGRRADYEELSYNAAAMRSEAAAGGRTGWSPSADVRDGPFAAVDIGE